MESKTWHKGPYLQDRNGPTDTEDRCAVVKSRERGKEWDGLVVWG